VAVVVKVAPGVKVRVALEGVEEVGVMARVAAEEAGKEVVVVEEVAMEEGVVAVRVGWMVEAGLEMEGVGAGEVVCSPVQRPGRRGSKW
jgi:hypothetical protein